mmetsp:Transcript_44481/g.127467  ORF Transcript_44481/g.127467 Transcript_44481/m.127467 type:complete len:456 (-) Transcript_44481:131-1498(-)
MGALGIRGVCNACTERSERGRASPPPSGSHLSASPSPITSSPSRPLMIVDVPPLPVRSSGSGLSGGSTHSGLPKVPPLDFRALPHPSPKAVESFPGPAMSPRDGCDNPALAPGVHLTLPTMAPSRLAERPMDGWSLNGALRLPGEGSPVRYASPPRCLHPSSGQGDWGAGGGPARSGAWGQLGSANLDGDFSGPPASMAGSVVGILDTSGGMGSGVISAATGSTHIPEHLASASAASAARADALGDWWKGDQQAALEPDPQLDNSLGHWWADGQRAPDARTRETQEYILDTSVLDNTVRMDLLHVEALAARGASEPSGLGALCVCGAVGRDKDDDFALEPAQGSRQTGDKGDALTDWLEEPQKTEQQKQLTPVKPRRQTLLQPPTQGGPDSGADGLSQSLGDWWADGKAMPDSRTTATREFLLDTSIKSTSGALPEPDAEPGFPVGQDATAEPVP